MLKLVELKAKVQKCKGTRFGLFMFAFLILTIILFPLPPILASIFGLAAFSSLISGIFYPRRLEKIRQIWINFGILLSKITNPIVLAIIYFLLITPYGVLQRLAGKDELRLKANLSGTNWTADSGSNNHDINKQY